MDIVLDFDGTITAEDTIGCLGGFAVSRQQQQQQQQERSEKEEEEPGASRSSSSSSNQATWDWIVAAYMQDHRQHAAAFVPAEADRADLAAERAFLASLRAVDAASVSRVNRSGLFAGCEAGHLFEAGRDAVRTGRVAFRAGFAEFVAAAAAAAGARLSVLSVNWSASFIRGVLSLCDSDISSSVGGDDKGQGVAKSIREIISNEIALDGSIGGPPGGGKDGSAAVLTTSADKLRAFRQRNASKSNVKDDGPDTRTSVYFGDSVTDLECLLEASAGVVMADDGPEGSALLRTLSRLGFDVPRVSEAEGWRRLVWARDFGEVMGSGYLDELMRASLCAPGDEGKGTAVTTSSSTNSAG